MDSTGDAKIDERQVYLTFKNIFASDGSKDKLRKRILNHKRIDVNAKQLAMDYGLEVVIKTVESMVDDKLFTSSDIAGSRFKNLSNEGEDWGYIYSVKVLLINHHRNASFSG